MCFGENHLYVDRILFIFHAWRAFIFLLKLPWEKKVKVPNVLNDNLNLKKKPNPFRLNMMFMAQLKNYPFSKRKKSRLHAN